MHKSSLICLGIPFLLGISAAFNPQEPPSVITADERSPEQMRSVAKPERSRLVNGLQVAAMVVFAVAAACFIYQVSPEGSLSHYFDPARSFIAAHSPWLQPVLRLSAVLLVMLATSLVFLVSHRRAVPNLSSVQALYGHVAKGILLAFGVSIIAFMYAADGYWAAMLCFSGFYFAYYFMMPALGRSMGWDVA